MRQVVDVARATVVLVCFAVLAAAIAATPALGEQAAGAKPSKGAKQGNGAKAKRAVPGRLDPTFGAGGKATIPFPAENDSEVGVKYELPFQFTPGHLAMAAAPGGRLVVVGSSRIARLLANGTPDPKFGKKGMVSISRPPGRTFVFAGAAVDSQGRILVAGSSRPLPTSSTPDPLSSLATVMRFTAKGSPDASFGNGGVVISDFGIKAPQIGSTRYIGGAAVGLRSIAVDAQDRPVLTGGSVTKVSGCDSSSEKAISTGFVARLDVVGGLDAGFGEGGLRQISDFESYEQGSIVPGGGILALGLARPTCSGEPGGGGPPLVLTGLGTDGNLNPGFGISGFRVIKTNSEAPVVSVARSGKIILLSAPKRGRQLVFRLFPSGAADPGFGHGGEVTLNLPSRSAFANVALDKRGRVLLVGRVSKLVGKKGKKRIGRSRFLLARLNLEGTVDRGFGMRGLVSTRFRGPSGSFATQVMLDGKGRIVVGGGISTSLLPTGGGYAIARYLAE
jgi:uncharacterized delta-60 repeat protein